MSRSLAVLGAVFMLAALAGIAVAKDGGKTSSSGASRHTSITQGIDCSNCHTPESWNMAGGKRGEGFDHSNTGFPLTGRHSVAACNQCHDGERRVTRQCSSCHRDPHQHRLTQQCDSCHSSRRWDDTQPFEIHRRTRFPLTGMHALADCTECHQRNGERQWTTVPSDCFSCHSAEYLDPSIHPSHTGTADSPAFPQNCAECHRTNAWSPAFIDPSTIGRTGGALQQSALVPPEDHDRLFPISRGPHKGAACNSCHISVQSPRLVRCGGCHEHNPVLLRQQHGRNVPSHATSCLGCHPGGSAR
jgi:hypothetical protein